MLRFLPSGREVMRVIARLVDIAIIRKFINGIPVECEKVTGTQIHKETYWICVTSACLLQRFIICCTSTPSGQSGASAAIAW